MAAESSCIPNDSRGDSVPMSLYAKNLVMEIRARDVIGADVEDDRMTCRKGCKREGVSKVPISEFC